MVVWFMSVVVLGGMWVCVVVVVCGVLVRGGFVVVALLFLCAFWGFSSGNLWWCYGVRCCFWARDF